MSNHDLDGSTNDSEMVDHAAHLDNTDTQPGSTDALRRARLCARVGCGLEAVATLTADYEDRMMAVGPLSPVHEPPALDLCEKHRDALTPPSGWQLVTHDGL